MVQKLNQLAIGDRATIVRLDSRHPAQQVRLSSMGVIPGVSVQIRQKRPASIIAIGETTLAIDPEVLLIEEHQPADAAEVEGPPESHPP